MRVRTGSFRIPPSGAQTGPYLAWAPAHAVRAGDLEAPLDRHVPESHVLEEMPVLGLEVVEADREEHVVVHRVALRPVPLFGLEVGRAADAGSALDEAHVERCHGGFFSPVGG